MERDNRSDVTEFFLLGFSDLSLTSQGSLFAFFLIAYILSCIGNGLIVLTVTLDPQLQTPMYYFLRILSIIEICSINVTAPKALEIFLSVRRTISFVGCAAQFFVFAIMAGCECVLLAVMAFDRYMAICHPLRYTSVMTEHFCFQLTIWSWVIALVNALSHCCLIFTLNYCGSHHIAHFFCDVPPLVKIACGNKVALDIYLLCFSATAIVFPCVLIFCSYIRILTSIFLIHSSEARLKTMSTCGSHIVSVVMFFGTAMFVHLRLGPIFSSYEDRMTALFYSIIIPTINPLVYSLKNKEVKTAIRRVNAKMLALCA